LFQTFKQEAVSRLLAEVKSTNTTVEDLAADVVLLCSLTKARAETMLKRGQATVPSPPSVE